MGISFTKDQQKVIDLRDCNILVSAAAGSGKTAVLVERIVQKICDDKRKVDIDRLLVVTFTKAAAAEMRERIHRRLAEELKKNPSSAHLQRQYTLVHRAQITTIDSFCLNVLRNHFQEIGLDPDFRIVDEGEKKLLIKDTMAGFLEELYAGLLPKKEEEDGFLEEASMDASPEEPSLTVSPEDFAACEAFFMAAGKGDRLEEILLSLCDYADTTGWPEETLLALKTDYDLHSVKEFSDSAAGQFLLHFLVGTLKGYWTEYGRLLKICDRPAGPYMYADLLAEEMEGLEKLTRATSLEALEQAFPAYMASAKRLPSKADPSVNADIRESVKKARGDLRKEMKRMEDEFFSVSLERQVSLCSSCKKPLDTLLELAVLFRRKLMAAKQEKHLVDFSDLEHLTLQILFAKDENGQRVPSSVAKEYRSYFDEIMIDEYQDSNLVQEEILSVISKEEDGIYNRFMVGDVKQSIYSFRQARPDLFLEKYESYRDEGMCTRIDLSKNFRSRQKVVDSVNRMFAPLMGRETGGLEYDERAMLYAGATFENQEDAQYDSELILVDMAMKDAWQDATGERKSAYAMEAMVAAQKIRKLTESGRYHYHDIVLLHRSPNTVSGDYKAVFEEQGIPLYMTSGVGYFSASEVQNLLQYLRIINNPRQDIPLYGVLISPLGGFTEEEISLLRGGHKELSLYQVLKLHADMDGELAGRVSSFLNRLSVYRQKASYLPVRRLLQLIMDESNYLEYVTALPAGSRRRANVEMLLTKASDFEQTSYCGVYHFVRYIDQLQKYNEDFGEADILDENADVVRMMSIHKSKGLEFPVVILTGMGHGFNEKDRMKPVVCQPLVGLGCEYVSPTLRSMCKTIRHYVVTKKMLEESRAEEIRVLYVALTRPKEKLIMIGLKKEAEKGLLDALEFSEDTLSYQKFLAADCQLDFLFPVLSKTGLRPEIASMEELKRADREKSLDLQSRRHLLRQAEDYADKEKMKALQKVLAYEYPRKNLEKLYTKTTVSELKMAAMAEKDEASHHMFDERERESYVPGFMRGEEGVSGTTRGSAMHRAMELLDFDRTIGALLGGRPETEAEYLRYVQEENIKKELGDLLLAFFKEETESLRLQKEFFDVLVFRQLADFFQSPYAYRMWTAAGKKLLRREQPFVLSIPANRQDAAFPETETLLIQGIIDVYFEEDGELVLLDYKTDRVNQPEELWRRYDTQMDYYKEALEKLTGKPVKEKVVYSFCFGEAFSKA